MKRAHSAGSRKSSACQRASQVVFRITMLARKIRASQAENGFHLSEGCVLGEQLSGEPQVDNAPVGFGKALANLPTLNPALINGNGSLWGDGRELDRGAGGADSSGGKRCHARSGRLQKTLRSRCQDRLSCEHSDPRAAIAGSAALTLLVVKAGQSSQVAPVGAGQIAAISVSQLPTHGSGQRGSSGVVLT